MAKSTGSRRTRVRELKAAFDRVHTVGMQALEARDLETFGAAIDAESAILQEQSSIIEATVNAAKASSRKRQA